MKPATIQVATALIPAAALAVLASSGLPAVGVKNSACERYPATSGRR